MNNQTLRKYIRRALLTEGFNMIKMIDQVVEDLTKEKKKSEVKKLNPIRTKVMLKKKLSPTEKALLKKYDIHANTFDN